MSLWLSSWPQSQAGFMAIFSDTVDMNTLLDTLWYFCYITVELAVLFIVITALVEIILMYIP